jgi:hypothetical protein
MRQGVAGGIVCVRKEVWTLATVSHDASAALPEKRPRSSRVLVPEMWASLAIAAMWLAVLFDALFGPNFVSSNGAGTNTTSIPSAVFVALFAYLGTRVVARYGFSRPRDTET